MNVVHIGTGIMSIPPRGVGAVENAIYDLTNNLSSIGCSVDVIDIRYNVDRGKTNVRFYEVKIPSLCDIHPLLQVISFAFCAIKPLYRLAKNRKIDIIHTHSQFVGFFALLAKRLFRWKTPLLYTTHNVDLLWKPNIMNEIRHFAEFMLLRNCDHIITPTKSIKERLVSRFRLHPSRITSIQYGINLNKISPNHPKSNRENPIILYPARICRRKNQLALLKASIPVLKKIPEARFVIAGPVVDRKYFASLKKFTKENNLSRNVEFQEALSKNRVYELYRKASVVAFPTLYETQGVILIEAMAFGIPLIASDIGPIRDVVSLAQGSAILIDPKNPEELAFAIVLILEDKEIRQEISDKGKTLVAEYFSWSKIAEKTADTYGKILYRNRLDDKTTYKSKKHSLTIN